MVQWFKSFVNWLFTDRRPKRLQSTQSGLALLSYNVDELSANMQQFSLQLFHCRTEESVKILVKAIDTAKNIQILEVNRISPDLQALQHHRGRLQALTDLSHYLSNALDPEVYAKNKEVPKSKPKLLVRNGQRSSPVL